MVRNIKEITQRIMQEMPEYAAGAQDIEARAEYLNEMGFLPESLPENPLDVLSPTDKQALALMAKGLSNRAIADELSVSKKSAEERSYRIFRKLGLSNDASFDPRVRCIALYQKHTPDFKNPVEEYFGEGEIVPLTPTEKEVVRFLGEGYSTSGISFKLGVKSSTVDNCISRILNEKIPVDPQRYDRRAVLALISKAKHVV